MRSDLSRRQLLTRSAAIGCCLAASPAVTPISFASLPTDNRLVVILLRGGMDGLDALQPLGDPGFAGLSAGVRATGALDLDGFFAMHPSLGSLMPLWQAGQLRFAHAVSTPYRDKRSHFDGQDLLEAGTDRLTGVSEGWLNRALQGLPGSETGTAYAIGRDRGLILQGTAPVSRWSPDSDLTLSAQAIRLAELIMSEDPRFAEALDVALDLADQDGDALIGARSPRAMMQGMRSDQKDARKNGGAQRMAEFAAGRLLQDARIASFSINGWDTHDKQAQTLSAALGTLADTLLALRENLGAVWENTCVLTMTEFGRTARVNGTGGTDHGTGGAMILAGGALSGARVVTDWPGLSEAALYDRRDLMPTRDLRAHAAWALHALMGLPRDRLENVVFPGLSMGHDPRHIA